MTGWLGRARLESTGGGKGGGKREEMRAVLYATFSEDREEGEGAETMDAEAGHGDHTSFSMAPREQCHCLSEYLGARL